MDATDNNYDKLRQAVEKSVGRKMRTPKDFEFLAMRIYDMYKFQLSPTTLKRFWGYIEKFKETEPRRLTLDILSMVAGYKDWDDFCTQIESDDYSSSNFIKSPSIYSTSLQIGNIIKLYWSPGRCVTIKYMGEDMFEVLESINSKLRKGDRFCCGCFIEGEQTYLTRVVRENQILNKYVCGKEGGIKFVLYSDTEPPANGGGVKHYISTNYTEQCRNFLKTATLSTTIDLTMSNLLTAMGAHL